VRLELRGVTKRFPGVLANDAVDLTVEEGQIHALLGENGAGKTTLMNVLYGLYHADEGEIVIDGETRRFDSPGGAIAAGLGMVHQHFMLIPVFTVTENIILGNEPSGPLGWLDRARARRRVEELSQRFGLEVPAEAVVEDLPVGIQQRVEILKALYREADVLILDEPTAVLTPQETDELFAVMRSLRDGGKSIIFITHKLKEVLAVADTITVLRDGRVVGRVVPGEADEAELASMMVGRAVRLTVDKPPAKPTGPVLVVDELVVADEQHRVAVHASFDVNAGEIVCVAGVQGNGQTELVEAITGLRPVASGHVELAGHDITNRSVNQILDAGVGHVPEDRQRDGLIASFTIADNLVLDTYDRPPFARHFVRDAAAVRRAASERVARFDVRTPTIEASVSTLSGGNQQKVILARELSRPISLLIASQPTRGLDVGSIEYIHEQFVAQRDAGVAVLIVSSELDEILALGDRIIVLFRGRVFGVVDGARATREHLGLLMAGVTHEEVAGA
jgi:ABC-type uncharacterized transport system ATPase subunit